MAAANGLTSGRVGFHGQLDFDSSSDPLMTHASAIGKPYQEQSHMANILPPSRKCVLNRVRNAVQLWSPFSSISPKPCMENWGCVALKYRKD